VRLVILHWSNRRFGGTGTYLANLLIHLERIGISTAMLHEHDAPVDHAPLTLPADVPSWTIDSIGIEETVRRLRAWKPDIVFGHGFLDQGNEAHAIEVAPAVFFAHDYYGTCISGTKTHKNPTISPCDRVFGPACLAHYYPRRCGGWSPISMVREYRKQSSRLELLRRYNAIVTHSVRMRDEYLRHGFSPSKVFKLPYGLDADSQPQSSDGPVDRASDGWRLLFVGRMYEIKGGRELLDALPSVARRLQRRLRVTFAGDGAQRPEWERRAASLCAREPMIQTEFTGWLAPDALARVYERTDLVVMPSLWPEPFGLVGSEAGLHGVPVAAFALGGIPDWLQPGVNGELASGDPPTVDGLADAIISCLRDERVHARLSAGARRLSKQTTFGHHVRSLLEVFDHVSRAA
jgi:glycosyltransferase involved in cell wall biosynthesis